MKVLKYILLIIIVIGVIIMVLVRGGGQGLTPYSSVGSIYNPWAGKSASQVRAYEAAQNRPQIPSTTRINPTTLYTREQLSGSTRKSTSPTIIPAVIPGGGGGGSGTEIPAYQFPQFNIGVPDLSWNPTEGQRGNWLEEAIKRAALVIDPQVAGREQGLTRFQGAAQAQREEIRPRYDAMSSAIANVFKNVVDQSLVNNAIRRGAAGSGLTSGWLGAERVKAGREELGQRRGVENERNRLLDAINAQVMGKEEETSDALLALEGLRGKQTDVSYADLERLARGDFLQEKQGTFENELERAIFQSGYSTNQANYLLDRFSREKSASIAESELGLAERGTALDEAMAQFSMRPDTGFSREETPYTVNIEGQEVPVSTSQFLQHFYNQQNAGGKNGIQSDLEWLEAMGIDLSGIGR